MLPTYAHLSEETSISSSYSSGLECLDDDHMICPAEAWQFFLNSFQFLCACAEMEPLHMHM